jgi:PAS domain S-box-containing protein
MDAEKELESLKEKLRISERRSLLMESRLKKSEQNYQNLFDNIGGEMHKWKLVHDADGEIKSWVLKEVNSIALQAWGKTKEEVIGKTPNEIFKFDAISQFMGIVQNIFKTKEAYTWIEYFEPTNQYLEMTTFPEGNCFSSIGRDVSQEITLTNSLRDSEAFLNKTGAIAKVGGWRLSGGFEHPHWTRATYDIHEMPYDYIPTTKEGINFYHPEDRDMVAKAVNDAIRSGKSFEFEARIITARGNLKWVLSKGEPEEVNGEVVGIIGVFQDITDRKQSELRLRESENKFKTLFQSSSVAKVLADEKGRYVDANEKACKLLGYSHEELTAMSVSDVVVANKDLVESGWEEFKQEEIESGEVELITKNGETIVAEYYSKKINEKQYVSTLIDITEKRKTEAALNYAKNRLIQISNSIPGYLYQIKMHKDGSISIPFIDDKSKSMWGFELEKMKDAEFLFSRIHPDDYNSTMQSIMKANQDQAVWSHDFRALNKQNETVWARCHSFGALDNNGDIIHNGVFFDVTKQKMAEEELINSRKQYKNIADSIPGMVLKYKRNVDGNDQLLYVSQGVQDLYGVSPSEAMANNQLLWNRVHPDDVDNYALAIKESSDEMSIFKFEHRLKLPDGSIKWVTMQGVPEKQKDGSVIWDSIGLDITKRKEAELELEQVNKNLEDLAEKRAKKAIELSKELELYWLAAEHAKTGVWYLDVQTNKLKWDKIMYDLFGIEKDDFSGAYEAWESSLLPEDVEENVAALQETIEHQKDLDILFRIKHKKTGEVRYIRGKGRAETNDKGETVAVFGTNYDVSKEMRLAEEREKIIKELEIYKEATFNAEVGVWDHYPEKQITVMDDVLYSMYELDKKEFPNGVPHEYFAQMIHPEDRETALNDLKMAIENDRPVDVNFRVITAVSKSIKHIRAKGTVDKNEEGEVLSVYGTNWDTTKEMNLVVEKEKAFNELKATQNQLIQSEKMASLGVLTAGVAHELNNPLNFIKGGCTAIMSDIENDEGIKRKDLEEYLSWISSGLDRSTRIVQSLGFFSRDNESFDESCSLNETLMHCLSMLNYQHKDRINIKHKLNKADHIITGNSGKLHQVFLNLLSNAIDSISEKGEIDIEINQTAHDVVVIIADTGIGIKEDNLKKVLDPFYTTKEPGKGTGLGLYISNTIIKEHKGNIDITSIYGKGTKVTVTLPKN